MKTEELNHSSIDPHGGLWGNKVFSKNAFDHIATNNKTIMATPLNNRDPLRIVIQATMNGGLFWTASVASVEEAREKLGDLEEAVGEGE